MGGPGGPGGPFTASMHGPGPITSGMMGPPHTAAAALGQMAYYEHPHAHGHMHGHEHHYGHPHGMHPQHMHEGEPHLGPGQGMELPPNTAPIGQAMSTRINYVIPDPAETAAIAARAAQQQQQQGNAPASAGLKRARGATLPRSVDCHVAESRAGVQPELC